ncbi:MAG: iron ABC transporter permease [Thermoleophilaceae bacterium]|nr:iron ABC transporter permease [Thermoleophilaceae bacterium]
MARKSAVVAALLVLLVISFLAAIGFGAVRIPVSNVLSALFGGDSATAVDKIVLDLRLPRAVEAVVVGAALGVAGALLQGALNNQLASPDIVGVTGGAGFGAVLILVLFPAQVALLPIGALIFGLLAAALVFAIAWTGTSRGTVTKLILGGIAIGALFAAGTTAILTAYPDRVPSVLFFIAGGLTSDGWHDLKSVLPYFVVGFVAAVGLIRPLDRLALGDEVAASLGSRPQLIRLAAGIAAALLAAAAASLAGLLAFLGLVVPHLVRMAAGTSNNTYVIPVSALGGATLLLIGDTIARVIAAPTELPVGPFMVLLGVPMFLYLLRKAD